jgi:hypothetical protein
MGQHFKTSYSKALTFFGKEREKEHDALELGTRIEIKCSLVHAIKVR